MFGTINEHVKAAGISIGVVVVLCLLGKGDNSGSQDYLTQAHRWTTAAEQDSNPLQALMHTDYAIAYATMAARKNPDEDSDATLDELETLQGKLIAQIVSIAPKLDSTRLSTA